MTRRALIAGDVIFSVSGSKSMRRDIADVSRDLKHLLGYDTSTVRAWNNKCTALLSANPALVNGFVDFRACMDTVLGHPDYVTNPVHMQYMLGCSVGHTRWTILGFINQPTNYKKRYDTAHSQELGGKIIFTRLENRKLGAGELGEVEFKHEGVFHKCTLAALASKARAPCSRTPLPRPEEPPPKNHRTLPKHPRNNPTGTECNPSAPTSKHLQTGPKRPPNTPKHRETAQFF